MKLIIILLLLSTVVSALNVADYPYLLLGQDFYLIKGDLRNVQEVNAANIVSINFPATQYQMARSIKRASEVSVLDRPAILVGTPCSNSWIQKIYNSTECRFIAVNEARILAARYNGFPVVVVTGGSPYMVLLAARWLSGPEHLKYLQPEVRIMSRKAYSGTIITGRKGELLSIGQPIAQVTPVIILGSQRLQSTNANAYLRPGDGKVIFGRRNN